MAEEGLLVVTDPGDVAVQAQQCGGYVQFLADIGDVIDPVCPARHREAAGLVEQQPATSAFRLSAKASHLGRVVFRVLAMYRISIDVAAQQGDVIHDVRIVHFGFGRP